MQTVALKTRLPFDLMCFVSTQGKSRYSSTPQSSGLEVIFFYAKFKKNRKVILLINVKITTMTDILTCISMVFECRNIF